MSRGQLLLAEDDHAMREVITVALTADGFDVVGHESAEDLHRTFVDATRAGTPPDLVITDFRLPGMSGLQLLETMRSGGATLPIVVVTAFGDAMTHEAAYRLGASAILDKPFETSDLRAAVLALTVKSRVPGPQPRAA